MATQPRTAKTIFILAQPLRLCARLVVAEAAKVGIRTFKTNVLRVRKLAREGRYGPEWVPAGGRR